MRSSGFRRKNLWFERLMAIAALTNLGFVAFDLSYVPWRDFWFRNLPQLTQVYDRVKGIEPHRETEAYLESVNALEQELQQSPTSLSQRGIDSELQFFNREIRPLMAVNYYRRIGENGEFVDWFWLIDAPFVLLFGTEFLARTFYLSRRRKLGWLDAALWRWYDLFLLLPFFRWLRIIPVLVRLDQAEIISLARVRTQLSRGIVANISEDMAEVVVVQIIDRVQDAIDRGEVSRWLLQSVNRPYIDLNQRDEIQEITTHLIETTVYKVLPKIKPDLEALLRHNVDAVLSQSPAYQGLKSVPMVGDLPRQINERLISELTEGMYGAIVTALQDKVGADLVTQLVKNFGQSLSSELQQQRSLKKMQTLAIEFLEEVKINYVRRLGDDEVERILEETQQIRKIAKRS